MGNMSKLMPCSDSIQKWTITVYKVGDKVAQLVRCRTSNHRVAGSILGRGTLVCPWARQFIP